MKWLQNILLGCIISLASSYVTITLITLANGRIWTGADLLEQILLALIAGVIIGAATMLFEIEHWPMSVLLIIHLTIVLLTIFTVGAFGDWYDRQLVSVLQLFIQILIIYAIVWSIMLLLRRHEMAKINALLQEKQQLKNNK